MLVYNAITTRDLIVVQGATLVVALTFVVVNLMSICSRRPLIPPAAGRPMRSEWL